MYFRSLGEETEEQKQRREKLSEMQVRKLIYTAQDKILEEYLHLLDKDGDMQDVLMGKGFYQDEEDGDLDEEDEDIEGEGGDLEDEGDDSEGEGVSSSSSSSLLSVGSESNSKKVSKSKSIKSKAKSESKAKSRAESKAKKSRKLKSTKHVKPSLAELNGPLSQLIIEETMDLLVESLMGQGLGGP